MLAQSVMMISQELSVAQPTRAETEHFVWFSGMPGSRREWHFVVVNATGSAYLLITKEDMDEVCVEKLFHFRPNRTQIVFGDFFEGRAKGWRR